MGTENLGKTRAVTIKDIARKLGVSVTTVSKALNGHPDISQKRRDEIMRTVEAMNYVPNAIASNLRQSKSRFIGLIISDNSNPYYSQLIKGAETEISSHNFQTIIFNNNEDIERELQLIRNLKMVNVAGVVITPARSNAASIELLKKFEIPFVLANRFVKRGSDNYVVADDIEAARMATSYLLQKREWDIAFINGDEKISAAEDRRKGFVQAHSEYRRTVNNKCIITGALNQVDGYESARKLLSQHRPPLSILCFSDYVATGVLGYLKDAGINVPGEVAVMGFDNIDLFSFWSPRLTTVDIPEYEIGKRSVEMLFDVISGEAKSPQRIVLPPALVIRETA